MTSVDIVRIADYLAHHARHSSKSIALRVIHSPDTEPVDYCWSDIADVVSGHTQLLSAYDLQPGDHVASWLPNGLDWIALDLASQLLGCVHVALDRKLPPRSAIRLAQHSNSRLLVVEPERVHSMDQMFAQIEAELVDTCPDTNQRCQVIALEVQPGERRSDAVSRTDRHDWMELSVSVPGAWPAQIMYTSGTMSEPKGVVLTHHNLLSNAHGKLAAAPQFATDVRLNILPFSHAYARTCELSTWLISGSQLCVAADWPSFQHHAPRIAPTLVNLVPHLAIKLSRQIECGSQPRDLLGDRLRLLQVGGAALPVEDWDRLASVGWAPLQGYGLTETSPVVCSNRAGQQRRDCVGYAIPDVELRVDDAGVLWTRGPHVMAGYWRNQTLTDSVIIDGWFCTGDLAEIEGDGAVRILGRHDDLITLSTGYKVSPFEVASRLQAEAWIDSIVIVGQNRAFIAALIAPRWDRLDPGMKLVHGRDASTISTSTCAEMEEWMLQRIAERLRDLPNWMQIRRVAIWTQPLTIENGGLNFKGAVRRRHVEEVLAQTCVRKIYEK